MLIVKVACLLVVVQASPRLSAFDPNWAHHELGATGGDVATLVLLKEAAEESGARCLDGSPAGYYYRPGNGNGAKKWYIHHEGGGWCTSLDDCLGRSKTGLGSSASYAPSAGLGGGYFSQDPAVNPMMANWNSVYLKYCDGSSFSSFNASVTEHGGAQLHFRGKAVLDAVQQDLLTKGLAEATDVVISGCSAGGLAAFLHVDGWAALLNPHGTRVVGLPDSGFFLDHQAIGGDAHDSDCSGTYHSSMKWVFEYMNCTLGVNQKCISAHKDTADTWKCMFAEHTSPHIAAPTFPLQGQYDSWQIGCDLFDKTDAVKINAYGKNLTDIVERNLLGTNAEHGIFLDSCNHHCGGWGLYDVNGKNQAIAFQEWYEKGAKALPNKGYYAQRKPYPCTDCCAPSHTGENIWRQATNPVTSRIGVQGYKPINVSYSEFFGGLEYEGGVDSLLDGNPGLGTWWYAVGSFYSFPGGIPGPTISGAGVALPRVELFVWDDLSNAWVLMLRQTDGLFFQKDEFAKNKNDPNNPVYAALDDLEKHRSSDGTFLFRLRWPSVQSGTAEGVLLV